MKNPQWYLDPKRWLLLIGYAILVSVSFLSLSTVYHQELTSDQCIQALMATDFSWQSDLYYWGQNRLGSFLPALASPFVATLPAHPLVVVSIIQYLLVLGGFLLLTSELKNPLLRLALACAWFLPFPFLAWNLFIGQPYTSQFFLLGLCLFLLKQSENVKFSDLKRNLLVGCSLLSWMLSAWVNDLMLVLFPVFLIYFSSPTFRSEKNSDSYVLKISLPKSFSNRYLFFGVGGAFIGLLFLLYAKEQAYYFRDENPFFSSFTSIFDAGRSFIKTIYKAATFQVRNVLISFHTLLLMLSLLLAFIPLKKNKEEKPFTFRSTWLFFLLMSLLSLCLILCSRWVEINGYDSRYFCPAYYFFLLALGYRIVSLPSSLKRHVLVVCVCIAVILSSISSLLYHRGTQMGDERFSFREQLVLGKQLGDCAVIGNYRNAYSISAGDPYKIVSTPHESDHVRNSRCVEAMLKKEKVYLIRNEWLEFFPDTITLFGRHLNRAGMPFHAQHLKICEYH